jgi:alpha-glucosidase
MFDVLRFWLNRGLDGFRVDVIHRIVKDARFRDNPPNPNWREGMDPFDSFISMYNRDWHEIQPVVKLMRQVIDEYPDRVLIGEAYLPNERLMVYYGYDPATGALSGVHLPFNFQLISLPWNAATIRAAVDAYEAALPPGAWPNWVLGNHDRHRFITRYGRHNARTATMLLLTLRGTPTVYYGDEIGMEDVPIPPDRVQDPYEKQVPGIGVGRDPERTPMQWDSSPNAGFCPPSSTPWLPLAENYREVNVAAQWNDPTSMLSFFRKLTALRREVEPLNLGEYRSLEIGDSSQIFAFMRTSQERKVLVLLNFESSRQLLDLAGQGSRFKLLLSTNPKRWPGDLSGEVELGPNEGLILEVITQTQGRFDVQNTSSRSGLV